MSDRRLQVFTAVAKLLSFTKAADALHMTQPAVTFQVRQLEESFNTRLFDRSHNRISLTKIGKEVYQYSQKIMDLYSDMDKTVRDLTGEMGGYILLGASTTVAEYLLPQFLGKFKEKYPSLTIRLIEANSEAILQKIENNEIDLGVVESEVHNKKLHIDICQKDEVVLIVAPEHELANKKEIPITKLLEYKHVVRELGSGTREVVNTALQNTDLSIDDLDIVMEMGSPESIKGAVESGIGISLISRSCVVKELQLGTLREIRIKPRINRNFSFVYQNQQFRMRGIDELLTFFTKNCNNEF